MTGRPAGHRGDHPGASADGWRASAPELTVTVVLILATSAAVYGYAGVGAAVVTLIVWAVVVLVLLRCLVTTTAAPLVQHQETWRTTGRSSFTGFWRKHGILTNATASMMSYDAELRPTLQHLLAARLAERHDVNLYQDPSAARRLLLPRTARRTGHGGRDDQLWYWLDPARPAETRPQVKGIPPRTLAAIIDRLERL
jgi:hypothetical protein